MFAFFCVYLRCDIVLLQQPPRDLHPLRPERHLPSVFRDDALPSILDWHPAQVYAAPTVGRRPRHKVMVQLSNVTSDRPLDVGSAA